MVNTDNLISSLLKPRVKIGMEWVNKGQNLEQVTMLILIIPIPVYFLIKIEFKVNWAIGALAKAIYARMFAWLIKRCNKTLDAQDRSRDYFIGVLDIAGFEIFDVNKQLNTKSLNFNILINNLLQHLLNP